MKKHRANKTLIEMALEGIAATTKTHFYATDEMMQVHGYSKFIMRKQVHENLDSPCSNCSSTTMVATTILPRNLLH